MESGRVPTNVKRISVSLESPPRNFQIQIGGDTLREAARVMIEGENQNQIEEYAAKIASAIEREIGSGN